VRSSAWFGEAVARQLLHAAQSRQPTQALCLASEAVYHPGDHVVDRDIGGDRGATLRQGLENQRGVEPRQSRSALILANIDAGQAESGGLADDIGGEMFLLIPLDGLR